MTPSHSFSYFFSKVLCGATLVCVAAGFAACSDQAAPKHNHKDGTAVNQKLPPATDPEAKSEAEIQSRPRNNFSRKVPTENGAYLVTLRPQQNEFLIGKPQPWVASITDALGAPFTPRELYFDGGMPGHGHGLPSSPRFTRHLGGADFLLEGMTLNMPGDWRFVVTVGGDAGTDSAVFDMNIQPGPVSVNHALPTTTANLGADWTSGQLGLINSLRLDNLQPAIDKSNRFVGNKKAIALGRLLFSEPGLSATKSVSCASCHLEQNGFADNKALSVGSKQTARHTPALLGAAQSNWFYWDGRRDSLWAQAITPIETVGEMDSNRTDAVRFIAEHPQYSKAYAELSPQDASVFSELTDSARFPAGASPFGPGKRAWYRMSQADQFRINSAYATLGKIIASFEATLVHQPSRFDQFAQELNTSEETLEEKSRRSEPALSQSEQAGLKLFLDLPKTQCLRCHNGALFTNHGFHNVASAEGAKTGHDFGRMLGLQAVIVDPFNCSGEFSDATADECNHLMFARRQNLANTIDGAFKVPGLRNLANTAPYFHDGRFSNLSEVIDHYRNQGGGASERQNLRASEVPDIELTDNERDQLVAFLKTL